MAVLFGDKREDGLIRVWRTVNFKPDGTEHTTAEHPDGYDFAEMPEQPTPKKGIDHIWLFNPETKEHIFEEVARPLTKEEREEELIDKMTRLVEALEKQNETI